MEYIGHLKGERTQLLIEHLKGTAELCESFAQNLERAMGVLLWAPS